MSRHNFPKFIVHNCRPRQSFSLSAFHHSASVWSVGGCSVLNNSFSKFDHFDNNFATVTRNYGTKSTNKIADDDVKGLPMKREPGRQHVVTTHKVVVKTYDFLTYPIYTLIQMPGKRLAQQNLQKTERSGKVGNIWDSMYPSSPKSKEIEENKLNTLTKLFNYTMTKYKDSPCIGTRPVLTEEMVEDDFRGKRLQKTLGDFVWKSYGEVDKISNTLSTVLMNDLKACERTTRTEIAILSDHPREEWLLTVIAAFKSNFAVVTICPKLSNDEVIKALNEHRVSYLFTSDDFLPRCHDILKKTPLMQTLVHVSKPGIDKVENQLPHSIKRIDWSSFLKSGEKLTKSSENVKPGSAKRAIIACDSSGPEGQLKKITLTHQNVVSAVGGMADALHSFDKKDGDNPQSYLALLPLSNILALPMEAHLFLQGGKIGYGSLATAIKASPGLNKDTKADAAILKPTVMAVVPETLESLSKSVVDFELKTSKNSRVDLIHFFYDYKLSWTRRGYETPITNKVLFQKYRVMLGGKVRLIFCGGPQTLDPKTGELVDAFFATPILYGYGGLTPS